MNIFVIIFHPHHYNVWRWGGWIFLITTAGRQTDRERQSTSEDWWHWTPNGLFVFSGCARGGQGMGHSPCCLSSLRHSSNMKWMFVCFQPTQGKNLKKKHFCKQMTHLSKNKERSASQSLLSHKTLINTTPKSVTNQVLRPQSCCSVRKQPQWLLLWCYVDWKFPKTRFYTINIALILSMLGLREDWTVCCGMNSSSSPH